MNDSSNRDGLDHNTTSTTSSPQTPPTPLPISVGPDNQKYLFSSSPTPSPPFSPPHSSHESLPLLQQKISNPTVPSPFSLDLKVSEPEDHLDFKTSCLKHL